MGIFDFLRGKRRDGEAADDEGGPVDRKLASLAKTASDKRAQSYDRDEALRGLIEWGTPGAARALLKRFKLSVDPSITDQEEKELAFEGIVRIGKGEAKRVEDDVLPLKEHSSGPLAPEEKAAVRDAVVREARAFCDRAESLNYALRVLRELLDDEPYEHQLLEMLSGYDTEYTRNVEPKIDIITAMESLVSDAVRVAVEPYLDDVNETVRFHAVETTFKQGNQRSIGALLALMEREESVRIKNKVCEGMIRSGWHAPEDLRARFAAAMSDVYEYRLSPDGKLVKAG